MTRQVDRMETVSGRLWSKGVANRGVENWADVRFGEMILSFLGEQHIPDSGISLIIPRPISRPSGYNSSFVCKFCSAVSMANFCDATFTSWIAFNWLFRDGASSATEYEGNPQMQTTAVAIDTLFARFLEAVTTHLLNGSSSASSSCMQRSTIVKAIRFWKIENFMFVDPFSCWNLGLQATDFWLCERNEARSKALKALWREVRLDLWNAD